MFAKIAGPSDTILQNMLHFRRDIVGNMRVGLGFESINYSVAFDEQLKALDCPRPVSTSASHVILPDFNMGTCKIKVLHLYAWNC